jgi:16S rRNA (guanine966-N2)-methyltransferase
MKHRVRQATFNLVGPAVQGKHAIDLFAGSGALGLEALSRGAAAATFIERNVPTAQLVRKNIRALGVGDRAEVITASAFTWVQRREHWPDTAWVVFCSPPYDFYVERTDEMLAIVRQLTDNAPAGTIFVVEADGRFDFGRLPFRDQWDVRSYPPAWVGLLRL